MPRVVVNCCLNPHLYAALWKQTNVTFRDFQSTHINVSQGLLQGTYIAGMGVDLKFIFQEDIRESSLLLHKIVFRSVSKLKLHDYCYYDFLHSLVENELKNMISMFTI